MAKNKLKKILVIRFSAMGDVAMTVPIIYSLASKQTDTEFVMLSQHFCASLFAKMPSNVRFWGIDTAQYAGWYGLHQLYSECKNQHFDAVVDLHDVLRTKYLRMRFWLNNIPTAKIDKGRSEKKKLTRCYNKIMRPLPSNFDRYAAAFEQFDFHVQPCFRSLFEGERLNLSSINAITGDPRKGEQIWIGVAPFAKHQSKIYPFVQMEQVLEHLSMRQNVRIFLFGGGQNETLILQRWENLFANTISCAGELTLEQELMLMSSLDVMLSMDSANMHLASLVNVPVVSIWGGTHPYAGFMGWNQAATNTVQVEMNCRPCSVFGNKTCRYGTYACMQQITPESVLKKIEEVIIHQRNA